MTTDVVPVAPRPGTDLVPDGWWESTVMPWADEQTDEQALQDASAQVAGMQAAYEQIGADTLELTRARRVIEIRWGELLGPARVGRPPADAADSEIEVMTSILDAYERRDFRKLATARDRVVLMLREADDPDAITRRALLRAAAAPEVEVDDDTPTTSPAAPEPEVDESPEARVDRKTQRARDALGDPLHRAAVAAEAAHDAVDVALTDAPVSLVEQWRADIIAARKYLSSTGNKIARALNRDADE